MRSARCLYDSTVALRRVFLQIPYEAKHQFLQPMVLRPHSLQTTQVRAASFRGSRRAPADSHKKQRQFPRDEELLRFPYVHIHQEDGGLADAVPTKRLLSGLDLDVDTVVTIAMPEREDKEDRREYPIVMIVNRQVEMQQNEQREKAERRKRVSTKELELNWAIDKHDLGHRLKALRGFLAKGLDVEVTLLKKRNKREAAKDEAERTLESVKAVLQDVPGSTESKKAEGKVMGTYKLFLKGPTPKASKSTAKESAASSCEG